MSDSFLGISFFFFFNLPAIFTPQLPNQSVRIFATNPEIKNERRITIPPIAIIFTDPKLYPKSAIIIPNSMRIIITNVEAEIVSGDGVGVGKFSPELSDLAISLFPNS